MKKSWIITTGLLMFAAVVNAETITAKVYGVDGRLVGQVVFEDNQYGLLIKPNLTTLPKGIHGFHIHQNSDCGDKGMKAGGHLDPAATNSHQGPYGKGHLGDLPVLIVNDQGEANVPSLAPRLTTKDLSGHAIMIHAGGDTYSDTPAMGGGGDRIACGALVQSNY